jgi:hypothetical protein
MATQLSTLNVQSNSKLNWKRIWRVNAIINALFGDALIFATPTVLDILGMEGNMSTLVRLFGLFCVAYAGWQWWASRHMSRRAFLVGDAVESLLGIELLGLVLFGVQLSTTGTTLVIGVAVLGFLTAALWFTASRRHQ